MAVIDATETILREIQRQLKDALDGAQRERELAYRPILRIDQFEARLDSIAADIRVIRSDISSMEIKLAALPVIEQAIRQLAERTTVAHD
jgi:DNA repair exonuclease SbcCD ATPase subunit